MSTVQTAVDAVDTIDATTDAVDTIDATTDTIDAIETNVDAVDATTAVVDQVVKINSITLATVPRANVIELAIQLTIPEELASSMMLDSETKLSELERELLKQLRWCSEHRDTVRANQRLTDVLATHADAKKAITKSSEKLKAWQDGDGTNGNAGKLLRTVSENEQNETALRELVPKFEKSTVEKMMALQAAAAKLSAELVTHEWKQCDSTRKGFASFLSADALANLGELIVAEIVRSRCGSMLGTLANQRQAQQSLLPSEVTAE